VLEAVWWGALAASTLLVGAVIAELRPPPERRLGLIMGLGAGVLLSAVSFELVEEAVRTSGGLRPAALGLFTGAAVFTVGDAAVARLGYEHRKDIGGAAQESSGTSIVLGALLDGVPESAVLGLTLLETGEVGIAVLAAVVISNLPEGIAATTGLLSGGWSRRRIILLWSSIVVASAVSAGLGYLLLDGASDATVAFTLAFAGGAVLTMLSTSMMPEAYDHAGRTVGLATVGGFALAFWINWLGG
jgi:ZIP family zinc transporter